MSKNRLCIYFQPILSVRSSKVIGVEALMRAFDENGEILSPLFVFEQAKKEGVSFVFDKFVRKEALYAFSKLYDNQKDLLLFLNFESHLLNDKRNFGDFDFCSIARDLKIPFKNIVLEIKEDEINNTENLYAFCKHFKEQGFLLALDDFGAGNANFDRISSVHPHIVKIDRSLIYDIDKNFINKEILKSISNMCFNIGALVLAEGVESREEILRCMKQDIDIFQGFWFAKPQKEKFDANLMQKKLIDIGMIHTESVKKLLHKKETLTQDAKTFAQEIIDLYKTYGEDKKTFMNYLQYNSNIEAFYFIDNQHGIQQSSTYIQTTSKDLFQPAQKGDSHSLKEYFYITKESKRGSYLSGKYISRASGKMCRTYTQLFTCKDKSFIVCIDLKEGT